MQSFKVRFLDEAGAEESAVMTAPSSSHLKFQLEQRGCTVLDISVAETSLEDLLQPEAPSTPTTDPPAFSLPDPQRPYRPRRRSSPWQDFWAFRYLLTPGIIRVNFVLLTIAGLFWLIKHEIDLYVELDKIDSPLRDYVLQMGGFFFVMVVGWFFLRLIFESTILFYRIYERIGEVGEHLRRQ